MKTRARPKPMLAALAPLAISRNGRNVSRPVRQALSIRWIEDSREKPV